MLLLAFKLLENSLSHPFDPYLMNQPVLALIMAFGLALVHVFAGKLRFLHVIPRTRWLSFAGGISVAYVFIHLLPELKEFQETLQASAGSALSFLESHAYLVALAGLVGFYGIERHTNKSRKKTRSVSGKDVATVEMFQVSIAAFACYNMAIGYLLVRQGERSLSSLATFSLAVGLHFLVNDYALQDHHKDLYARYGRWLLSAAIIAGAVIGQFFEVNEALLAIMISFLSGGIVLNVLKEELPEERESCFSAFALGVVGYAGLLLAT
jgi:zinc transporter ZupT